MNRDLGPSFNIWVTQLESIKESHEVVNFVSTSFDYEFVDFGENRLKYRNNPQIMKKLWQKHSKDKKKESGSNKKGSNGPESKAPAKRKRIVEAISRDELPKVYIDKAYVNYYDANAGNEFATRDVSAKTDEVADMEMTLINTIKGFSPRAGQSWHLVDEVFVPINCDGVFHWILTVIALKDRCIRVYDSMTSSQKHC
ncbi:hypothetical protein CQW23_17852 [Capsicum baccatum]|uniref:Ubiquitin-like protease family profile domain-containing protein n=1 Tax=Capsicum baccatum TaxID=33114 RepID=A0A2G2WF12_CAPBA|nr:hypothetical protein CQW23_17852 [Capsicum baccatum]